MKNLVKKFAAVILAAALAVACLSGCGINWNQTDEGVSVVVIDDQRFYLDELKLYIYETQYELENIYSFYIAYLYGTTESFFTDTSYGSSYWDYDLSMATARLIQTKVLIDYAKKNNIALTDEEKAAAKAACDETMPNLSVVLAKAGNPSEELVLQYFTENALANKVYNAFVADIDRTFDEEKMLRKSFEGVSVTAKTSYTETVEKSSTDASTAAADSSAAAESSTAASTETKTVEISAADQEKYRKQVAEDAQKMLKDGHTVTEVVAEYKNNLYVTVSSISSKALSKAEATDSDTLTSYPYYEKAWSMTTGEYAVIYAANSSKVTVGYVLHMTDDDDAKARADAKLDEIASRKSAMFAKKYAEILKNYKVEVITDELAKLSFSGSVIPETEAASESAAESESASAKESAAESESATESATESASETEGETEAEEAETETEAESK